MLNTRSIVQQFDAENGHYVNGEDGWLYYANGAKRDRNSLGPLWEPSDLSTYQRLVNQREYWNIRLEHVVDRFNRAQDAVGEHIKAATLQGHRPSISAKEVAQELGQLKKTKQQIEEKIDEISEQIDATTRGRREAEQERGRARAGADAERERRALIDVLRLYRM